MDQGEFTRKDWHHSLKRIARVLLSRALRCLESTLLVQERVKPHCPIHVFCWNAFVFETQVTCASREVHVSIDMKEEPLHHLAVHGAERNGLTQAIHWLQCVFAQRNASREEEDRKESPVVIIDKRSERAKALCSACLNDSPLDTFIFIVEQEPGILLEQDDCGWLPLHYACQYSSLEVVSLLVDKCPESLVVPDDCGRLPLHVACDALQAVKVLELLLKASPDTLLHTDKHGMLPLHVACTRRFARLECIRVLVQANRFTILHKCESGDTCLQLAFHHVGIARHSCWKLWIKL